MHHLSVGTKEVVRLGGTDHLGAWRGGTRAFAVVLAAS